jgi:signal transduction histidine kinase
MRSHAGRHRRSDGPALLLSDEARRSESDYAQTVSWIDPRRDLVPACALAAVGVASLLIIGHDGPAGNDRAPDALGYALVVISALALVARRRHPLAVLAVSMGAALVVGLLGYATGGLPAIAPLFAVGSAAYHTSRRTTIVIVAGGSLLLAALYLAFPPEDAGRGVVGEMILPNFFVLWLVAAAGDVLREQRAYAGLLEQRTEELAQLRKVEKREAIVAERTRIARDMHDIVGHALAAIALQARAGRRRLARGAVDGADVALGEIDAVAGQALADTRRAVGLLRSGDSTATPTQPALQDLDELVEALRTADVQIDFRRQPTGATLSETVEATAYRIVQESLSNVVKHAYPAHATVTVRQDADSLVIDVRDAGTARDPAQRTGHGLRGMHERAAAVGGTLDAGPAPGGGWQVVAHLPHGRA